MGLERFAAEMILGLAANGETIGPVGMLGRQHLNLHDTEWARAIQARLKIKMDDIVTDADDIFAESFFERVGAASVDSLDFSPYQGANLIHDMNDPLPDSLKGRFQLLHDGGTMEHVFHIPHYLANCMKLLQVGGFYVGVVPADQWMGHGFYQFSPELLFRVFSEANGFRLRAHGFGVRGRKSRVYAMPDDRHWKGRMEPLFEDQTLLLIVAQKMADVEPFAKGWPQQSDYASRWSAHENSNDSGHKMTHNRSWKSQIGGILPTALRKGIQSALIMRRRSKHRNTQIKEIVSADQLLMLQK
jgi:hypothetical protein